MRPGYPVWRLLHRKHMTLEVTPVTWKRLRGWGVAGLALFAFWLALVGVRDPLELAVGAGAAVAGAIVVVVLMLLAESFSRPSYYVVPLTLAPLSLLGGLLFARFLPTRR